MNQRYGAIDVMIGGAQKAGTSSLHDYLAQHPDIATHHQLEMAFFVRNEEYLQGYEAIYPKYFSHNDQSKTTLTKSVGIMYLPSAMRRLYDHNPNCKIVIILREPVSRAYSAYWYMRRVGHETAKSFEKAIALESIRHQENFDYWSACLYRDRGIYHRQLHNLYDCFGKNNVHVLLLDDLIAAPQQTIEKILKFLDIPTALIDTSSKSNAAKLARSESLSRVLEASRGMKSALKSFLPAEYLRSAYQSVRTLNERTVKIPKISPQAKQELADFFKPHNLKLAEMIERPLNQWTI